MKKGVMFSFVMVFIVLSILSLISIQRSIVSREREQMFIETRINSMNNIYDGVVRDVEKSLQIITRRAMSVAFTNVSIEGEGLDEANVTLWELVMNGTIDGVPQHLMENTTLTNWTKKIEEVATLKGFDINITPQNLVIKPYDSFNLLIEGEVNINITDLQDVASLSRTTQVNSIIPIEELEDPLYPLQTGGIASNLIRKSDFHGNFTTLLVSGDGDNGWIYGESVNVTWTEAGGVSDKDEKILVTDNAELLGSATLDQFKGIISNNGMGSTTQPYINNTFNSTKIIKTGTNILLDGDTGKVWYIDNLIEHTENSYYIPSDNGPSYLDRLEGELSVQNKYSSQTDKTIGIESTVNKNNLYLWGISVAVGDTNIDYLYFSGSSGNCVKGLDSTFRIDNSHKEAYNVTDLWYSC